MVTSEKTCSGEVVFGQWCQGAGAPVWGVEAAVRSGGTWGCVLAREGSGGQWKWHVGLCALVRGEGSCGIREVVPSRLSEHRLVRD